MKSMDWEASGALFGIVGSFLLAIGPTYQKWGWLFFLASNLSWLAFAVHKGFRKLQLQTLAFLATTVLGICHSFIGQAI
ncbi:MAG: hypothetical protein EPN64_13125 [Burkholderiaceae bacterium]|nr:MAG: hypothetical protein EPN64_13125 [Burkholderiaceae bacterium]